MLASERARRSGVCGRTRLFVFFDAQLAQTRDLLLELLAHLGKILGNFSPYFEDRGANDFLEELGAITHSYLESRKLWDLRLKTG